MNYLTAEKIQNTFKISPDFEITVGKRKIVDDQQKGYIYGNLYFYDDVKKEVDKLRAVIEKIYKEVAAEGGDTETEPEKLLLDMSTRATRMIGDDSLDYLIKEFLSKKSKHICLMSNDAEVKKLLQVHEALFLEITAAFYAATLEHAADGENGEKEFRLTRAYISNMTERQKKLFAPALKLIAFEHRIRLTKMRIGNSYTVKYIPEQLPNAFISEEDKIKEAIKEIVRQSAEEEEE